MSGNLLVRRHQVLVDCVIAGCEDPMVVIRVETDDGDFRILQMEMDLGLFVPLRVMGKPVGFVEDMECD